MSKAPAGAIFVSEDVRTATGDRFGWDEVGTFAVKGKSEPVAVSALAGTALRQHTRALRYPLPLQGRDGEMAIVARAVADVRNGSERVVAIAAAAGRGKSRLMAEVVRTIRGDGLTVAFGEAPTIGTSTSYAIWKEVWRFLLGVDERDTHLDQQRAVLRTLAAGGRDRVRRAPLLDAVLGLDLPDNELTASFDAKLRKASLEALLVEVLRDRVRREPIVILLEDCHWIDALSRDLLETLVREMADEPVLFLLTYRPAPTPGGGLGLQDLSQWSEVVLDELGTAVAEGIAQAKFRQLYGDDVVIASELIALVVQRAEGNPFHLEELINYFHGRGIDPGDASSIGALELPATLHNVVLSRIDDLTEEPRRTLKVASILGRTFASPMLQRVYPELGSHDEVHDNLDACRSADLMVIDQVAEWSWLFRHAVTQDVAYQSLPFALREQLHERAGTEIERDGPAAIESSLDLLAHHWWNSSNRDKKVEYLRRAGDAAQANYANDAAIDYFDRLVGLLDPEPRIEVLRQLGKVLELVGNWGRAHAVDEEALSLAEAADDQRAAAACEVALAEVARKQGQFVEARTWLSRAAARFGALDDDAGIGQVQHLAGTLAAQRGDYAQARTSYLESLAIRERLEDRPATAAVLSNLGVVAEYEGDLDLAHDLHHRALALRVGIGDRWAIAVSHTNLGMIAIQQGQPGAARDAFAEAMRLNLEVGDTWMVAISHNNLGNAHRDIGDHDSARAAYAIAAEVYRRQDDRWALAFLFEDVALLAAALEMPVAALELLGAADRCREDGDSPRSSALDASLMERLGPTLATLDGERQQRARARGQGWGTSEAVNFLLTLCDTDRVT